MQIAGQPMAFNSPSNHAVDEQASNPISSRGRPRFESAAALPVRWRPASFMIWPVSSTTQIAVSSNARPVRQNTSWLLLPDVRGFSTPTTFAHIDRSSCLHLVSARQRPQSPHLTQKHLSRDSPDGDLDAGPCAEGGAAGYRKVLGAAGMIQAMCRKGNFWDNAPTASCFGTLKTELVRQACYKTRDAARHALFASIEGYSNRQRLRSAVGYITPEQAERRAA